MFVGRMSDTSKCAWLGELHSYPGLVLWAFQPHLVPHFVGNDSGSFLQLCCIEWTDSKRHLWVGQEQYVHMGPFKTAPSSSSNSKTPSQTPSCLPLIHPIHTQGSRVSPLGSAIFPLLFFMLLVMEPRASCKQSKGSNTESYTSP